MSQPCGRSSTGKSSRASTFLWHAGPPERLPLSKKTSGSTPYASLSRPPLAASPSGAAAPTIAPKPCPTGRPPQADQWPQRRPLRQSLLQQAHAGGPVPALPRLGAHRRPAPGLRLQRPRPHRRKPRAGDRRPPGGRSQKHPGHQGSQRKAHPVCRAVSHPSPRIQNLFWRRQPRPRRHRRWRARAHQRRLQ